METIAAISTATGSGGIGIIRMSGDKCFEILKKIFISSQELILEDIKGYTIKYGYIINTETKEKIDEVLVSFFKNPKSYTRENMCEINSHGGIVVERKILEECLKNGAELAEPGEFTKRAFLNGKMDLSQAEAVGDLITAQNEYALKSSVSQLKGNVKEKISNIRQKIIYHTAFIETALDDPEHISVDGYGDKLKITVVEFLVDISHLLDSCDDGRILKEGIQTVIVGKPNAGKSSVLNVLLGEERAIVTDIAGTTRDTLEESIQIKGIPLNIIDTAGIRDTNDLIEKIGVDKAKDLLTKADLVLYVVDTSDPLTKDDEEIMELIEDKQTIVLLNKADLDQVVKVSDLKEKGFEQIVQISAKEQTGIEELYQLIQDIFFEGHVSFNDEIYLTNMRHKTEVSEALKSLAMVLQSIEDGMPEDFFSIDLLDAYEHLGFITGESVGEDLVNEIFAEFCMGK